MIVWLGARQRPGVGHDGDLDVGDEVDGVDGRGHQARGHGVGHGPGRGSRAATRAAAGERGRRGRRGKATRSNKLLGLSGLGDYGSYVSATGVWSVHNAMYDTPGLRLSVPRITHTTRA